MTKREIAAKIDHTNLKQDASDAAIERLCWEAREYQFATVCVNPCWVHTAFHHLKDSGVKVCSVVGFPLGASETSIKVEEALTAVRQGADEIDMVINVGAYKSRFVNLVETDIKEVVDAVHSVPRFNAKVKVIVETCLLTHEEKRTICGIVVDSGADFIKTSTGFSTAGASADDVTFFKEIIGYMDRSGQTKIKAAGGIRTLRDTLEMIKAGADRIGTSNGVAIINEMQGEL
jgi:deoxyribose-phosphate aldolase